MSARLAGAALLLLAGCAATPPSTASAPAEQRDWAAACADNDDWDKPSPPFRIAASTFYVGTCGISAILVTSPEHGHVLIDSGTEAGADVVLANIEALGFDVREVRYIVTSHEHFDHVGGIAKLQQMSGAQLVTSAPAAPVMRSGSAAPDDPQFGVLDAIAPARVDRIIADGQVVELGGRRVTAIATPGHTPGALSWAWRDDANGSPVTIVYADSLSPVSGDEYRFSDHPALLADYRAALQRVAGLECDVLLTPHPSASGMRDKLLAGDLRSGTNCRDYAAAISERLDARLAEEAVR
jgi:metallo-beta-lactamase class B